MLDLAAPTDPGWTDRALAGLDELLVDHAHCEKKAAGMAVQLLFQYGQYDFLLAPLSKLAREELRHFEEVLALMGARGIAFRRLRPSPYAGRLRDLVRDGEPERLIDTLLCSALIEARSCERFALLAESVPDAELASFYRGLLACEARHHRIYVELAEKLAAASEVRRRLEELSLAEAAILRDMPDLPRMHT